MAESAVAECASDVCQLYRHFDAKGVLLYVGMSLSAVARLSGHKTKSRWFSAIARVEVENFNTREETVQAELVAIRDEKPLYNILGRIRPVEVCQTRRTEQNLLLNAQRQAKWRTANTELNRQRAREGMRKLRAAKKDYDTA